MRGGLEAKPARRLEIAGRRDTPVEEGAAPHEAGDEAVRRPLVKIALAANLANPAVRHDNEPVGDRQRLLLVVRHHDRGEPELTLQFPDLDPHFLAQLRIKVREGSSSRRTSGRMARARASATRCCCPPES